MKARFLQDTTCEGVNYLRGEVYDLPKAMLAVFGAGVELVDGTDTDTETEEAATKDTSDVKTTDKMMKGAPKKK